MKKLLFPILATILFTVSCSKDDNPVTPPIESSGNYLDLSEGNYWVYDVTGQFSGRDSLYVAQNVTTGNVTHQLLKTQSEPIGFFSGLLNEAKLRKSEDKILATGSSNYEIIDGFPLNIDISDFIMFKENGNENQELSSISGTIEREYNNIPLIFEYKLKSFFVKKYNTYNVPNYGNHTDVVEMRVELNLKITAKFSLEISPTPISVTILNSQDVIKSSQFYSNNIGNVYTETKVAYQMADLSLLDVDLPFEQNGNFLIKEFLAAHN